MAASCELLYPRLVIFGATGETGIHTTKKALELGHNVTVVARNPAKLGIKHEKLEVVSVNIFDAESLMPVLEGKSAILSCLGVHGTSIFNRTTLYSTSMKAITAAMERAGLERVLCITSWWTETRPENPKIVEWFLKPLFLSGFIKDMATMERLLISSTLNYTIVRPPELTNRPANGKYKVVEGQSLNDTRWKIPREDVADFMLKALQTQEWDRKAMAIGSEK